MQATINGIRCKCGIAGAEEAPAACHDRVAASLDKVAAQ